MATSADRPTVTVRPTGTVTFLFTDIEGSTRLLQRLGAEYSTLLAQHHRQMRAAILDAGGFEVKTEGDSFFVIFEDAADAVRASVAAQRAVAAEPWPQEATVAVRMGLHTGEVELSEGEYVGLELHRAARIAATAHGGQVVLSARTRELTVDHLPGGTRIRDLGEHRLKDLPGAERLFQLDIDGLRVEFPPLASLSARFHVLPPDLTTFVGREAEMEHLGRLLAGTRLLTLTGPGGTGKSRLALRVARECDEQFRDGVAFVALAPIRNPQLVAPTVRQALGFTEEPGRSAVETLTDQLKGRELLLLLDNFEHMVAAAPDVAGLLLGTERLSVLVTSRAALHLSGEQEFAVPPLGLPATGLQVDPETIGRSEAVSLFVERARLARPGFRLDGGNARTIALICERLDGLPLAIELAASRIKMLPPDALLARLSHRLEILHTSGADRADRQRTLRATIDWSHDLLDAPQRAVFRRLAAFTGGASLGAIEALIPGPLGPDAEEVDTETLEVLSTLLDHSLLRQEETAAEPRFHMLETIREYGLERLAAAGEADALAEAHGRWFLALVAQLAPSFTAGPQALDQVEVELDNVRAALRWAVDRQETELALRSVGALWRFWHLRGHLREGRTVAADVLAMPGADRLPEARARALYAMGSLRYWQADYVGARSDYEVSLLAAREAEARDAEAEILYALGYVHGLTRDWEASREAFRASGSISEAIGDRLGKVNARFGVAFTDSLAGDWEGAASGLEEAMAGFEDLGARFWAANTRLVLGRTLQRLGRYPEAERLAMAGLDMSRELGDRSMEAMALRDLASIAGQRDDHERALRLVGASLGIEESLGGQAPRALVNVLDPITVARERGVDETTLDRLVEQGRAMGPDDIATLAMEGHS